MVEVKSELQAITALASFAETSQAENSVVSYSMHMRQNCSKTSGAARA